MSRTWESGQKELYLGKMYYILTLDIYKAYDQLDLEKFDEIMLRDCTDPIVLDEWAEHKADVQALNMNVNGTIIKRTIGTPQGSELSPFIFNYMTTCILKTIDFFEVHTKIIIYADNWILLNDNFDELTQDKNVILETIRQYGFRVEEKDIKIMEFNTLVRSDTINPMFPNIQNNNTILGINFINSENKLEIDLSKNTFSINTRRSMDPHNAILMIKKIYNAKFNYYSGIFDIWNPVQYNIYKMWYRSEIFKKLKIMAVIYKISNELLDSLIDGNNDPRSNYYWFYAANFDSNIETKDNDEYFNTLLNRWKDLASWLFKNEAYLGVHTLVNFIFKSQKTADEYIKVSIDKKNKRKTYINMDLLYNCIVTRQNPISFTQFMQEYVNLERSNYIYNPITGQINNIC